MKSSLESASWFNLRGLWEDARVQERDDARSAEDRRVDDPRLAETKLPD